MARSFRRGHFVGTETAGDKLPWATPAARRFEHVLVGCARFRVADRCHVETVGSKPLDDATPDVLIRQKAHHLAARTVSCCM